MAVPRALNFLRIGSGGQALEVYIDPICPYSTKLVQSLDANVIPLIKQGGKYSGKLELIARIYPQPFHYASHFNSEAILAFGQKHPDLFWPYLVAVFEGQKEFFNVPVQSLSANDIRDRLVTIATDVLESHNQINGPKSKIYGELRDSLQNKEGKDGSINGGNVAETALKHGIKIGRQNSIHVTPTAVFDGLVENSVSSSWGKEDWEKFLTSKLD